MIENSIPEWLNGEDALSLHRALFRSCALLPVNTSSELRWRLFFRIIMFLIMIQMLMGSLVETYLNRFDFLEIIECGSHVITLLKTPTKAILAVVHEKDIRYIFDKMMTNFYVHEKIFKEKIITAVKTKKRFARRISIPYISTFVFTVLLLAIEKASSLHFQPHNELEIINGTKETIERSLPIRIWFPINTQHSPAYEIAFFYQTIAVGFEIYNTTVIDTFIATAMMYVSTQFELLGASIQQAKQNVAELLETKVKNVKPNSEEGCNIPTDVKHRKKSTGLGKYFEAEEPILTSSVGPSFIHAPINAVDDNIGEEPANLKSMEWRSEMDNYLRLCIQRHQSLLEYVERLNALISPIELLQALTSSILMCTLGFTAISTGNPAIIPRVIVYTIDALVQIGLPCYFATMLQDQSVNIGEAAYNCGWYNEPVSYQKSIGMIIMRAQRPVYINLGPFGIMSLELFATVVQSAYTYLTVLRQFYE